MIKQGFLLLFRTAPDQPVQACPALAHDDQAAVERFHEARAQAQPPQPPAQVLATLSLHDLERHRRAILELADRAGQDVAVGEVNPRQA